MYCKLSLNYTYYVKKSGFKERPQIPKERTNIPKNFSKSLYHSLLFVKSLYFAVHLLQPLMDFCLQ